MKKFRALIIDDLALAIANLQADIAEHCPNIEIIGTANGVLEGAQLLKKVEPDVIFLDIQMEDGNGFDLLDIINYDKIHIIFTTASQEFAIKAFQYDAMDYLLKPIAPELLKKAVAKLEEKEFEQNQDDNRNHLILHTQEEIRLVKIQEIVRCESSNNYTLFYFDDGTKLLVSKTLKEYEKILPSQFIRVHQSHLINIKKVKSYVKSEGGYLLMNDGSHVSVSVRKKSELMEILSDLN